MQSRWSETEAAAFAARARAAQEPEALGLRVYSSRLIGQDPDLVLHGGGNTSVKIDHPGGTVIHVKGSGWDLGDIESPGLPAMHLAPLLTARDVDWMSDIDMVAFLRAHLLDPAAPNPSIEALLHAFLPFAFVDHTHASAVLALADQDGMGPLVDRIYGGRVGFVPYVMPGFDLSQACDRVFRANPQVEGLWLEKHGLFTFADTARESYERMIRFVSIAEDEIRAQGGEIGQPEATTAPDDADFAARLRDALAGGALGASPALDFRATPSILRLLARPDLAALVGRGTATPDHVIRIKPFPLILDRTATGPQITAALAAYAERYASYFRRGAAFSKEPKTLLDTLPRAVLVPGLGVYGLGAQDKAARIVGDLWEQTARILLAAESIGHFSPIREAELFEMEYWSLEQAKLKPKA